MHGEAEDNELAKLAIALVGLSGAYDGDAKRARRQLLEIFGRNLTADQLSLDPLDPDLTSVTDLVRATVGIESWLALLSEVAAVRIGLDDVRDILAALAANADLPALPVLEHSEELAQLKRLIAKGKVTSIYQEPRSTTACPKCHQRLPMAGLEQFRQRGLVRNLCCSGIMLRSDA